MSLKNLQNFNPAHPGDRRCAGAWVMQALADLATPPRRITRDGRVLSIYYPAQHLTIYSTAPASLYTCEVDVAAFLTSPAFLHALAEADRNARSLPYRTPRDSTGQPLF